MRAEGETADEESYHYITSSRVGLVSQLDSTYKSPRGSTQIILKSKSRGGDLNSRIRICSPPHGRYVTSALRLRLITYVPRHSRKDVTFLLLPRLLVAYMPIFKPRYSREGVTSLVLPRHSECIWRYLSDYLTLCSQQSLYSRQHCHRKISWYWRSWVRP